MRTLFVHGGCLRREGRSGFDVAHAAVVALALTAVMSGTALALPQSALERSHAPLPQQQDIKTPMQTFAPQPLTADRAAALAQSGDAASMAATPVAPSSAPNLVTAALVVADFFELTSVIFDEPGDGAVYALGTTYKARFAPEGFTYIPRFSASAPRNFALQFAIESVQAGGQPIAFDRHAQPQRSGESLVLLERGVFTEAYRLQLDSVEQTFTFDERPAAMTGDLVVRLSLATELASDDAGDRLTFSNEFGSVSYSKAVLVDAQQRRTDLATNLLEGDRVEITLPAALLNAAAWPITVDPIVQTSTVDAGVNARVPDAAYDSTSNTWLVAWEVQVSASDGDVLARRTDALGAPIGSVITIDATTENWRNPRVANNEVNNNHLVAAERGAAGARAIWGRVVSATNGATGATFQISDPAVNGEKINPDVGGDSFLGAPPVHWLVAWERIASAADHDIHARLVTSSAPTSGAPAGSTIFIDNSLGTLDISPAVSPSNRAFAWPVVWQRDQAQQDDIFGARVLFDGSIETAAFPVDNTAVDTQRPSVATPFLTTRYVVAYEEAPATLGDIRVRAFEESAMLSEGNLTLIEDVATNLRRGRPSIDASAAQFIVACEQESAPGAQLDAYVSSYCWDGVGFSIAEPHRRLAASAVDDARPIAVSASGSNGPEDQFLTAWSERNAATGSGPIRGAAYRTGTCCPADVDDNGSVDVDDLVAVILGWGACNTCAADINGDLQVNVDDLVAVILGWGTCA